MENKDLKGVEKQWDIRIQLHKSLKVATQVNNTIKTNQLLGIVYKDIKLKSTEVTLELYQNSLIP